MHIRSEKSSPAEYSRAEAKKATNQNDHIYSQRSGAVTEVEALTPATLENQITECSRQSEMSAKRGIIPQPPHIPPSHCPGYEDINPTARTLQKPTNQSGYRKKGWRLRYDVRYDGVITQLQYDIGLHYIAILIQNQGKELHATELVTKVYGEPEEIEPITDLQESGMPYNTVNCHNESGEPVHLLVTAEFKDPILPDRNRQFVLRHMGQCSEEDQEKVRRYLKSHRFAGTNATYPHRSEKDRKSVSIAIGRAIRSTKRTNRELADHLKKAIKTGCYFSYEPAEEISWELKPYRLVRVAQ